MQPLARQGLSAARVAQLLHSDVLTVSAGLELLNPDLTVAEDISDDLVGGKVSRNFYSTIHGTCDLQIARELRWGVDLVRPYMVLSDGVSEGGDGVFTAGTGTSARFDCGVYCLTTPQRQVGDVPVTYDVQGFDRLYLLDREVGADYTAAANVSVLTLIQQAVTASGLSGVLLDSSALAEELPKPMSWPLVGQSTDPDQSNTPVTWLRVINDLLRTINYTSVWADESGRFRAGPYRAPADRPVDFTFDAQAVRTILGMDRTVIEDVWKAPNRWTFVASNPPDGVTPSEANGLVYVVNNVDDGITSQAARGLIWPRRYDYEATSAATLKGLGDKRVALDRAVSAQYEVTTGPWPVAGHGDVYLYRDPEAGVNRRVQQTQYDLDLLGGDTTMRWEST